MNELHLFAGAGGGILGGILCGHTCVCAVEIEPYCRKVLLQRQCDGILPKFPIWDDVRTFDGKPWRGKVDVVCGGFPCQDISSANTNGPKGIDGSRSGLWSEMGRIIGEVRPRFAFVENSPMLVSRGLHRVLGDLCELGYDARWGVVSAENATLVHKRERLWILSYTRGFDFGAGFRSDFSETTGVRKEAALWRNYWEQNRNMEGADSVLDWFGKTIPAPVLNRKDNGVADLLDRLHAIGNGQVPAVVKLAWDILSKGLR